MDKVSIEAVARAVGVHRSTVSRALTKPEQVSKATRQKVEEAVQHLGYTANPFAQALRTKASTLVPLFVPDVTNPFFAELASAMALAASEAGFQMVLCDTRRQEQLRRDYISVMQALYAPFAVVAPYSASDVEAIRDSELAQRVVIIDRVAPDVDLPTVTVDNAQGIMAAIEHLWGLGHRSIAYVAGPAGTLTAQDRLVAYCSSIDAHGEEAIVLQGDFDASAGQRGAEELLAMRERPTAVLAANDLVAFGFISQVSAAGLRVPDDLSVMGYDGLQLGETFTPPLTSISQPITEMATAAITLARNFAHHRQLDHAVLMPELVVRASTTVPPRVSVGRSR